jgi:hypothetical protein
VETSLNEDLSPVLLWVAAVDKATFQLLRADFPKIPTLALVL